MLTTWKDALSDTSVNIYNRFIDFFPRLLGAVLILIIGWLIAVLLEKLLNRVFRLIGLQKLFELVRLEAVVKKAKFKKDTTRIVSALFKWIVIIITFFAAADVLGLNQVADFLAMVLGYVPNVIAAIAIVLIGAVLAHFLSEVVRGSAEAGELEYSGMFSMFTSVAIWVFAILAALVQLGIAQELIRTLFTGFVALVAIAGGLSFGLGGQDAARRLIGKIETNLKTKTGKQMQIDEEEKDEDFEI